MNHAGLAAFARARGFVRIMRRSALQGLAPGLACVLAACASDHAEPYDPTAMQSAEAAVSAVPLTLHMPLPAPAPRDAATVTPLDYYQWARAATQEELRAESLRLDARRALARQFPSDTGGTDALIDAVRLAIIQGESALATRESEREAKRLLTGIDAAQVDAVGRDYAIFAGFLLNHLSQREELRTVTSHVVASREELELLERDRIQLQEKIDALTRIEEQLIEREQAQGD